ncbi:hypothetical protein ACIQVE_12095 [Pseudomonas sp. NPDC098747]|uniref:hypothetical protein n=1 Tax=Pseudomonas sp. NPDC098747 TaxID=3364487 RepID=UPI00383B7D09
MNLDTVEKAQALCASSTVPEGGTGNPPCGRTLHFGVFFDGFGCSVGKNAVNQVSNVGRLFTAYPDPLKDDTFNSYRSIYVSGLGAPYDAPMSNIVAGATTTAIRATAEAVQGTVQMQAAKSVLKARSVDKWWENFQRDINEIRSQPLKGAKALGRNTATDAIKILLLTGVEAVPALRDSKWFGVAVNSGTDTRLIDALARFRQECEKVKQSSDTVLRTIKVSVFGFDLGATFARAFLRELLKKPVPGVELQLVFAGLFDAVDRSSANEPIDELYLPDKLDDKGFVPQQVQAVLHLIAAHERRFYRKVRLLGGQRRGWSEVLMPGVSEDIGGGLAAGEQKLSADLALVCLHKMYRSAYKAGVPFPQLESLQKVDPDTAELFKFKDQINQRGAEALVKHYLRSSGQHAPGDKGFTVHMRLYIRWLAHLWQAYSVALKALNEEDDRLHASQFDSNTISGLLGRPHESSAHREERLQRTKEVRQERDTLQQKLGWLKEVAEEAAVLRNRHNLDGVESTGRNRELFLIQQQLLQEWTTQPVSALDATTIDLFTYFMHDRLVLSQEQQVATLAGRKHYFAVRVCESPKD